MNIVDLRQTSVRQIEPLLEEESLHWRDELHWDYRGALELIKRFLEARALSGCVAYENGTAAGYTFRSEEESLHWRDELHWDYRGALELIKRFLEARALSGCVAYENGTAAGYTF